MIFDNLDTFYQLIRQNKVSSNIVAFDFGLKKVGVSVGSLQAKIACEYLTIPTSALKEPILDLWRRLVPSGFLVGFCFDYDDFEGSFVNPNTIKFCEFLLEITNKTTPILLYDENMSSNEVVYHSKKIGLKTGKKFKKSYDKTVATYLMQKFFNELELIYNI